MEQLRLLLVDKDIDARMRLRHAVSTVQFFGDTVQANNLDDARARLDAHPDNFDLVFLSYEFPREQLSRLVSEGKKLQAGCDAAYVMLYPSHEDRAARVSEGLLAGADGFLFEPYSIDDLVDMSKLAAKIKKKRLVSRQMLSLDFMIKDLIRLVAVYSRLKMMACDTRKAYARLKGVSDAIKSFEPEVQAAYLQSVVETFMLVPVPDPIFEKLKNERIRSVRLRQKLAENLADGKEMHRKQQEEIQRRLPPRKGIDG
jgi:response regulator RpfG family c-di-GMP phosphodiesterase